MWGNHPFMPPLMAGCTVNASAVAPAQNVLGGVEAGLSKMILPRGAWVAPSVKHLTLAQVTISVCEPQPYVGLGAESSEPAACFGFCEIGRAHV